MPTSKTLLPSSNSSHPDFTPCSEADVQDSLQNGTTPTPQNHDSNDLCLIPTQDQVLQAVSDSSDPDRGLLTVQSEPTQQHPSLHGSVEAAVGNCSERPLILAPSILAADFACLASEVRSVVEAGAQWVHVGESY